MPTKVRCTTYKPCGTGLRTHQVSSMCCTTCKHSSSSAAFSLSYLSRGYCNFGKGACGHLKDGISILWIGFDLVAERLPNPLPWNEFVKLNMARSGDPGLWFFMAVLISWSDHSTPSPRWTLQWYMKAALKASSFASVPDCAVNTWFKPAGLARRRPFSRADNQFVEGKFPIAGLFTSAEIISGLWAAATRAGWL